MIEVTSAEAQNHFGRLLDSAQREPVMITRHGRVAAYLLSPSDVDALRGVAERRATALEFERFFAKSDTKLSPAGANLTDEDVARMVRDER